MRKEIVECDVCIRRGVSYPRRTDARDAQESGWILTNSHGDVCSECLSESLSIYQAKRDMGNKKSKVEEIIEGTAKQVWPKEKKDVKNKSPPKKVHQVWPPEEVKEFLPKEDGE